MNRSTDLSRPRIDARERVLYLLTDPISTRLLRGQLAHLRTDGFAVELGCRGGPVLDEFARDEGIVVHAVPYVREPQPWHDLRALAATIRLIRRARPHIVNASTPKAGLLGMVGARCCGVPVRVYVVRGLRYETATGAQRRVLRTLERVAVRCSTHTIFNSASLRSLAEADGVVPIGAGIVLGAGSGNGVDAARFARSPDRDVDQDVDRDALRGRLGLGSDDVVIGFVGRFVQDKGFDDLVESFAVVADAYPQARLLLVGDYEAGDAVATSVRAAVDQDPRIVRTGWVEDPAALYAAMDVLAFPSYREGLPNVPLEAQAAGVPVVAYAATGTVDAVRDGETGRLVPLGDRAAFAVALRELVADRRLAADLGRAGSGWVSDAFAPTRVWATLADRYRAWSVEATAARAGTRRTASSDGEPLRVLWVVKGLGPGGAERLLVAQAGAHDPRRVTIDCVYLLPWKDHLVGELEAAGVSTRCLGNDWRWPIRLAQLVRSGGYDVVHVHSPLPGSVARLAGRSMGRGRPALVSTEHNGWTSHRRPTRWLNRVTTPWTDATFAVSAETLESLEGPVRQHAEVLVHGIDIDAVAKATSRRDEVRLDLGIAPDEVVVATVANFRPQKDYPNLLHAARRLADDGVPVRIVAVGQGPGEAETRALHAQLDLGDRVLLTGFRADAVAVLGAADVFVLASAWEGLPVALMEAFALGLPVVATRVGGVAETITHGVDGLLVEPGDSDALAHAMSRIVGDEGLRLRLARASADRAAEFDVGRTEDVLEARYETLTGRGHDGAATVPIEVDASREAPVRETSPPRRPAGLDLRPVTPDDRSQVIELLRRSLGWGEDPRFAELFAWKHDHNAFGPSPGWVACDGDRVVALRMFMRWEFVRDGEVLRAVRAVDTATDPEHRGRGLFRALTELGLEEMAAEGVDFVFNTPNQQSLPGYLTMGWREVGHLPASFRPSLAGLPRTLRARTPAGHWSLDDDAGRPLRDILEGSGDWPGPASDAENLPRRLRTRTSPVFLRWRYGGDVVSYRGCERDGSLAIFRHRRRGAAREVVIAATLGVNADGAIEDLLSATMADHALRIGRPDVRGGWLPLPGGGPLLTHRPVVHAGTPPLDNWSLDMGDVELF